MSNSVPTRRPLDVHWITYSRSMDVQWAFCMSSNRFSMDVHRITFNGRPLYIQFCANSTSIGRSLDYLSRSVDVFWTFCMSSNQCSMDVHRITGNRRPLWTSCVCPLLCQLDVHRTSIGFPKS